MGKYRILLVVLSLFTMFLDIYVNADNNSYFTTACVFFGMLLYDHEKITKSTQNKVQKIASKCSAHVYLTLVLIHIILLISSYTKAVVFNVIEKGVVDLEIQIFGELNLNMDWVLVVIGLIVLFITFTEVLCDKDNSNYKQFDDKEKESESKEDSRQFNPKPIPDPK